MAAIGKFPWNEEVLNAPCPFHPGKTVRETHSAFVGLDFITMMKIQKLNPDCFYSCGNDSWYSKQEFAATTTLALRWYLLLTGMVPGSEKKCLNPHKILPEGYVLPSAVAETTKNILLFKKTGIFANPGGFAQTNDTDSAGRRISIGSCDARRIAVIINSDGVGIGAERSIGN